MQLRAPRCRSAIQFDTRSTNGSTLSFELIQTSNEDSQQESKAQHVKVLSFNALNPLSLQKGYSQPSVGDNEQLVMFEAVPMRFRY